MRQRRQTPGGRLTIDDLARAYDRGAVAKGGRPAVRRAAVVQRAPTTFTESQGGVRLTRLKARADGIRFALQHENQPAAKAKVLQQILQNLELAIRGMEMTLRET